MDKTIVNKSEVVMMHNYNFDNEILSKVYLNNDFSVLTDTQKVKMIIEMCRSLKLNPATQPIKLLRLNGKLVPYATKDATEQLRSTRDVNIHDLKRHVADNLCVVTAYASLPNGRTDAASGAVNIEGKKGDDLANAIMKAETKAKRRVTLSICGLGFMDESEIETIREAHREEKPIIKQMKAYKNLVSQQSEVINEDIAQAEIDSNNYEFRIDTCIDVESLKELYLELKEDEKIKEHVDLYKKLIKQIEEKRLTLITGEVKNETV